MPSSPHLISHPPRQHLVIEDLKMAAREVNPSLGRLGRLPPELRNEIYELSIDTTDDETDVTTHCLPHTQLAFVSKQVSREAIGLIRRFYARPCPHHAFIIPSVPYRRRCPHHAIIIPSVPYRPHGKPKQRAVYKTPVRKHHCGLPKPLTLRLVVHEQDISVSQTVTVTWTTGGLAKVAAPGFDERQRVILDLWIHQHRIMENDPIAEFDGLFTPSLLRSIAANVEEAIVDKLKRNRGGS